MRVPDQIRKCILFLGVPGDPDPQYGGTAFIVTVPGTQKNTFAFMVTARHVAERLEHQEFYVRVNNKEGAATVLDGHAKDPWWYHPTERDYVDAAVKLFNPTILPELDVSHVPLMGVFT